MKGTDKNSYLCKALVYTIGFPWADFVAGLLVITAGALELLGGFEPCAGSAACSRHTGTTDV